MYHAGLEAAAREKVLRLVSEVESRMGREAPLEDPLAELAAAAMEWERRLEVGSEARIRLRRLLPVLDDIASGCPGSAPELAAGPLCLGLRRCLEAWEADPAELYADTGVGD